MAALIFSLTVFLAMATSSNGAYCVCKTGLSDSVLQKNIDYACGAGADCTPILQNGPCFNPNTVQSHCDWAVNSYYQRKGQAPGSCDFVQTATISQTSPSTTTVCVYPSSPSGIGNTPTTPPSTVNPGTSTPPGTGVGTPPGTGVGTPPGTPPGTGIPGYAIGPTGPGFGNTDSNSSVRLTLTSSSIMFFYICISLLMMKGIF